MGGLVKTLEGGAARRGFRAVAFFRNSLLLQPQLRGAMSRFCASRAALATTSKHADRAIAQRSSSAAGSCVLDVGRYCIDSARSSSRARNACPIRKIVCRSMLAHIVPFSDAPITATHTGCSKSHALTIYTNSVLTRNMEVIDDCPARLWWSPRILNAESTLTAEQPV